MPTIDEQLALIKRGVGELISEGELRTKLQKKKPLRVKAGFDPTAPDLHLGHTVLLQKLKQFQDLGHQVIFLIGDATARIGDPSGRSETRPVLSADDIERNVATYKAQVFKVLDPDKTEVRFNSEWLDKMRLEDLLKLSAQYTVARMLERDDFDKRYKSGKEISILEFLYPLLQGHDSVVLEADVEIGGNDQKFNLLMGRTLQRRAGKAEQVILTLPLLEGTDGVQKMSKSYGNAIGILDAPNEMVGKIMSIPDETMWHYYELLSDESTAEIETRKKDWHPKKAKQALAREITARFHGKAAAEAAEAEFEKIFANRDRPSDVEKETVKLGPNGLSLVDLMVQLSFAKSKSDARRLIEQGGVSVDGNKTEDLAYRFSKPAQFLLKVGKRQFKEIILR